MNKAGQTESGTLDLAGGKLPYEVAGEGHHLLLIHAGIADQTMWDAQIAEFSRKYRVIRYDTRGFGRFKTEDVEFSNRQDIYELLRHLGVEKTYIIGVSRGGQIAGDFTLEHPEMVDALVLVCAGLSGFDPGQPTEAEMALINEAMAAEEAGDIERRADLDVLMWVDGPGQPAGRADSGVREKVRQMCLNNYRSHTTAGRPIVLDPPAFGRLHEITVPTLVISTEFDPPIDSTAFGNALAEGIPGARKVHMSGVAHLPPLEAPQEFNRIAIDFLSQVDRKDHSDNAK